MDPLIGVPRAARADESAPDTVPDGLAEPVPALKAAPPPATVHGPVEFAALDRRHEPATPSTPAMAEAAVPAFEPVEPLEPVEPVEPIEPAIHPVEPAEPVGPVALVELLDRDGQVRQAITVPAWPLRIGRALDNHVVLSDPHVAATHLSIERGEHALEFAVGAARNGVQIGKRRLRPGDTNLLALDTEPFELTVGRTRMRLRLPDQPLDAEVPLASAAPLLHRLRPIVIAALVLVLALVFNTYLDTDPDGLGRAVGSMLLAAIVGAAIWCSAWALLSKTFTRQAHFGWHLRVFLFGSIAMLAVGALPALLAFSLSWGWLSDFAFVGIYLVGAATLYFHLLAVEPAKHRLLRWVAATGAVVGIGLTLWFNQQRSDQLGDELYMN
ncbi:MAG TPA: FHA domain-containing protein, partial [Burkholderiaceae bacterium]|nr:FHA domain-containing protein [Burkholderiaceae bacterium]